MTQAASRRLAPTLQGNAARAFGQRGAACAIAALAAVAANADRGVYIGIGASGNAYDVDYSKAVDNTSPLPAFGVSVYALAGVRRLDADFDTAYTGCPWPTGCPPGERIAGEERHDLSFDAVTVGAGIEKSLGRASVRAELRYTDHGESTQTVSFRDSGVSVPFALETSEISLGVSFVWRPWE